MAGQTSTRLLAFGIGTVLLLIFGLLFGTVVPTTGRDVVGPRGVSAHDKVSVISTIAGPTVTFADPVDDTTEDLRPAGLALDRKTGDLYITSLQKHRVLKRDAGTGEITLVAGTGAFGFSGDGGPAVSAKLFVPRALAFSRGMVFIADRNNNRIRVVNTTDTTVHIGGADIAPGHIATIAGNGDVPWNGAEGSLPAVEAAIRPNGLAIDDEGNLFIAHTISSRVLFMNLQQEPISLPGQRGRLLNPGHVTSVAGNGVFGYAGDGGPAQEASFDIVTNVDLDQDGTHVLFLADRNNHRVRVANLTGHTVKVAGVKIKAGNIDTVAGIGSRTNDPDEPGFDGNFEDVVLLGDGGTATAASLVGPTDVSVDHDGNIFITDSQDQQGPGFAQPRIRRVDGKTGLIKTRAGTGVVTGSIDGEGADPSDDLGDSGPPTAASFSGTNFNILLDKKDRVLISDNGAHRVRRIDAGG